MTYHQSQEQVCNRSPWVPLAEAPLRIGFILREHFSMVAFTAAVDAFVTSNLVTPEPVFQYVTISEGPSKAVLSDLGIQVSTDMALGKLESDLCQFDMLIVCGGFRCSLMTDKSLLSMLRAAHNQAVRLVGIWNGAIALVQAGLLHRCALHPDNHAYMREYFPDIAVSANAFEVEGRHATSAGPVSTLEMMLKLIGEMLHDSHLVRAVREILICDQVAEKVGPMPLQVGDDPTFPEALQTVLELMRANIEEPLSAIELANCAGISRRQMERMFHAFLETSPSRHYLELRLVHARRLLMQTNKSILEISLASGFVSSTHFSKCFKDYYGTIPTVARQHREDIRSNCRLTSSAQPLFTACGE